MPTGLPHRLFDDLQAGSRARARSATFASSALPSPAIIRRGWLDLEDHSLPVLPGVDSHHRGRRHIERMGHATEAPFEGDHLVIHVQMPHGTWRNVQDNLSVAGESGGTRTPG